VLLDRVLNHSDKGAAVSHTQHQSGLIWDNGKNRFGDSISKKGNNILRIEFQNKGGISFQKDSNKDNVLRCGISQWEFDIFGLLETNVDWQLIPEDHKPHLHMKEWWDSCPLIIQSCRATKIDHRQQFGSMALLSLNKSSHRVISKGIDTTGLGRWRWTRYHGKNNLTLRIIVAY
jgi:hypothetical protein